LAVGNLADGEILLEARARTRDADAFIGLDAGAGAFRDANLDAQGVPGLELGKLALFLDFGGLFGLKLANEVHRFIPLLFFEQPERPTLAGRICAASATSSGKQ